MSFYLPQYLKEAWPTFTGTAEDRLRAYVSAVTGTYYSSYGDALRRLSSEAGFGGDVLSYLEALTGADGYGDAYRQLSIDGFPRTYVGADLISYLKSNAHIVAGASKTLDEVYQDPRTSDFTVTNADGTLTTVASGEVSRGTRGLEVFGAATPLIAYSKDFSEWGLHQDATLAFNTETGSDGLLSASRVGNSDGLNSASIFYDLVVTGRCQAVIRVKAGTASTLHFGFYVGGWVAQTAEIVSGPGAVSGSGLQSVTGLSAAEWTVIRVTLDASHTNPRFYIYPETSSTGSGKDIIFDYAQGCLDLDAIIANPDVLTDGTLTARAAGAPKLVQDYGPERIRNNAFANLTGWTKPSNTTLSVNGGVLTATSIGGSAKYPKAIIPLGKITTGETFRFTLELADKVAGGNIRAGITRVGETVDDLHPDLEGGYLFNSSTSLTDVDVEWTATATDDHYLVLFGQDHPSAPEYRFTLPSFRQVFPFAGYVLGDHLGPERFEGLSTLGEDWTDNGDGSWDVDGVHAGNADAQDPNAFEVGKWYECTYTITNASSDLTLFLGVSSPSVARGNGTHTELVNASQGYFFVRAGPNISGTISNISIKEVLENPYDRLGDERAVNTDLDSDLTGWTNVGGSTAEWAGGVMRLTAGASYGGRYQDIAFDAGTVCRSTFRIRKVSGTSDVRLQTYDIGGFTNQLTNDLFVGSEWETVDVNSTPTGAGIRAYVQMENGDAVVEVDSFSNKQIYRDHTVELAWDADGKTGDRVIWEARKDGNNRIVLHFVSGLLRLESFVAGVSEGYVSYPGVDDGGTHSAVIYWDEVAGTLSLNVDGQGLEGPELVTNGEFGSATGWSLSGSSPQIEIAGGLLKFNTSGANHQATQYLAIDEGVTYRVRGDAERISGVYSVKVRLGGVDGDEVTGIITQTYDRVMVAGSSNEFRIRSDGDLVSTFDNASVVRSSTRSVLTLPADPTEFHLGHSGGSEQLNGVIQEIASANRNQLAVW